MPDRYELRFDVDYISEWVCNSEDRTAQFRLSPATWVFSNCLFVRFEVASEQGVLWIQEVRRDDWTKLPNAQVGTWRWTIVCDRGQIQFRASGYELHLRREPVLSTEQSLRTDLRGAPSFEIGE